MKAKWRLLSKIGMLLVVMGFFMPISCSQNGFQLAEYMVRIGDMGSPASIAGALLYVLFISALLSLLVGAMLFMHKKVSVGIDWILLLISIGSGVYVYINMFNRVDMLQSGAYVIAAGWGISLLLLLFNRNKNSAISDTQETGDKNNETSVP